MIFNVADSESINKLNAEVNDIDDRVSLTEARTGANEYVEILDLSSYTEGNWFTVPADGYLQYRAAYNKGAYCSCEIYGPTGDTFITASMSSTSSTLSAGNISHNCGVVFLKKGMRITNVRKTANSNDTIRFFQLG